MAVMEPFNVFLLYVLVANSVAVNLQYEMKNVLVTDDVKRSEDKKPEFTDVVTNQTVVAGRQDFAKATNQVGDVDISFSGRRSSPATCPTWVRTRWPGSGWTLRPFSPSITPSSPGALSFRDVC